MLIISKKALKITFIIILLSCFYIIVKAQNEAITKLEKKLKKAKTESEKIKILNDLSYETSLINPDKAIELYNQVIKMCESAKVFQEIAHTYYNLGDIYIGKRNYEQAIISINKSIEYATKFNNKIRIGLDYKLLAVIAFRKNNFDEADQLYKKSISVFESIKDKKNIVGSYNGLGTLYLIRGDFKNALEYLLKCLKIGEETSNKEAIAAASSNIAVIYKKALKQNDYALTYFEKALHYYRELGSKSGIANSLINIAIIYSDQDKLDKSLEYFKDALKIGEEIDDKSIIAKCFNNIGATYETMKDYRKSLEYYQKALNIYIDIEELSSISSCYNNIGIQYSKLSNYPKALEYFSKGLEMAKELDIKENIKISYYNLSDINYNIGKYKEAYDNFKLYTMVQDSIFNIKKSEQITEMQTKYETEKKERQIELLQKDKEVQNLKLRKNSIVIYSIAGSSVLILILVIVILNSYRNKETRRILLQKVIETEEKEKRRFAADLHDGLGPLLSSIGLYVNELTNENNSLEERVKMLKFTNDLIDEAVSSTRSIAHNLMPNTLSDFGLVIAIQNFCNKINASKTINIDVIANEASGKYNKTIEVVLYRVIMELINNTIKHAGAKNINIILKEKDRKLFVIYSDDGKGFNLEKTLNDPKRGLGLNNIINRIKSIEGSCEYQSKETSSTTVKIEINLRFFDKT